MSVITISRTIGSLGDYIGRTLAEELGYDYVDKDKIAEIIKDYGIIALDDIYNSVTHFWDRVNDYHQMTMKFLKDAMIAVADNGNVVIAGRGSYGLLQDFNDIIHVRIKAPFDLRVIREMEKNGSELEEAQKMVRHDDKMRKRFIENNFHFDSGDVDLFDVVLDTSIIDPDDCVRILAEVYRGKGGVHREDLRPSVHDVEIDPVLKNHVAGKMKRNHNTA